MSTKVSTQTILAQILAGQQDTAARLARLEGGAIVKGDESNTPAPSAGAFNKIKVATSRGVLKTELGGFVDQSVQFEEYLGKYDKKMVIAVNTGFKTPTIRLASNGELDVMTLALDVQAFKERALKTLAMAEGVERWLATKIQEVK